MLGISTAPKENLNISAEIVSGEFLLNRKSDPDVKRYFVQPRDGVGELLLIVMPTHRTLLSYIPNELLMVDFMFIWCDMQ